MGQGMDRFGQVARSAEGVIYPFIRMLVLRGSAGSIQGSMQASGTFYLFAVAGLIFFAYLHGILNNTNFFFCLFCIILPLRPITSFFVFRMPAVIGKRKPGI